MYLDLIPVRSFLHTSSGRVSPQTSNSTQTELSPSAAPQDDQLHPKEVISFKMHVIRSKYELFMYVSFL